MPDIPTLAGPVDPAALGRTLMHEHVFLVDPEHVANYGVGRWWDEEERIRDAVAKLRLLAAGGVSAVVDQTAPGNGRDIPRLLRVAREVDLHIIVSTGFYTHDDLPQHYLWRGPGQIVDGPEPMVDDFVRDIEVGIGDTGVRAGLLKCCVDAKGPTPGVDRVLRAVAQAHSATGVPISVHTDSASRSGRAALAVLGKEPVDPTKVLISHAGDSTDLDYLMELADTGATLGMDRFGLDLYGQTADRVRVVAELAARGYGDRMVLSHDTACFADYLGADPEPFRAVFLPDWHYRFVPDRVLPALLAAGVTETQIEQMLVDNPRRFLTPREVPRA